MKFLFMKIIKLILVMSIASAYVTAFMFTPWFHLHPGEDHVDTPGDIYHSHTPVSTFNPLVQDKDVIPTHADFHTSSQSMQFDSFLTGVTTLRTVSFITHFQIESKNQPNNIPADFKNTFEILLYYDLQNNSLILPQTNLEIYFTNLSPPLS